MATRLAPLEPAVEEDEGGGAGEEGDAGAPGSAVLECLLEQLEGDGRDQRPGREPEQGGGRCPRRGTPNRDQRSGRQRARRDRRKEDRFAHWPPLWPLASTR
jgi:hypothetical protein